MLKTVTVYKVIVVLNDHQEFNCLLLSEPTVEALAEAAKLKEGTPSEIVEALAFFREIKLPAKGDSDANTSDAITEVTIAGTILGSIRVVPLTAYRQPTKRGPNKKST